MAALASFPAREVVVGTMGSSTTAAKSMPRIRALRNRDAGDTPSESHSGGVGEGPRIKYRVPWPSLSCSSPFVVSVLDAGSDPTGNPVVGWPAFTFTMTVLAYVGAW